MAKNKAMYNQTTIQAAISAALGDAPNEIRVDGHIHRFRVIDPLTRVGTLPIAMLP